MADLIGYLGAIIIVISYAIKAAHHLSEYKYCFWNVFGGIFVSIAALYHSSPPNVFTSLFWAIISAYIVIKYRTQNKEL